MDRFANRWPWLLAIAAVVMVAGCGGGDWYIDPDFMPTVEMVQEQTGATIDVSIVYDARLGTELGRCDTAFGDNTIRINPDTIQRVIRKVVIHEIGHCIFDRSHAPDGLFVNVGEDKIPATTMIFGWRDLDIADAMDEIPGALEYYACEIGNGSETCLHLLDY